MVVFELRDMPINNMTFILKIVLVRKKQEIRNVLIDENVIWNCLKI